MIKNLTLLADFYEFTMSQGYFNNGLKEKIAVFDMFFRKVPDNGGYAIAVKGLMHLKEANWYQNMILTDAGIVSVLNEIEHKVFVISEDNFIKIFDKESVQKYLDFVNQNQLEVTDSEEIEKEIGFVK